MEGVKLASLDNTEPNYTYLAYLSRNGFLGGRNPVDESAPQASFGGLRHNDNGGGLAGCSKHIGKSAGANVGGGDQNNDVAIKDPQYKLFLEDLRRDGDDYFVEVELGNCLKERLRYESEKLTCEGAKMKTQKALKSVKPPIEKENVAAENVRIFRDGKKGKSGNASQKRKMALTRRESEKAKCPKNLSRERKRVKSSSRMREGSIKRPSRQVPWDDSYLAYLLCLRDDDNIYVYTNPQGKRVKYNEEEVDAESSSSDMEILSPEDILKSQANNTFVPSKRLKLIDPDAEDISRSELREKLIAALKMPYDGAEYKALLKELKLRKQQELNRGLRGGRDVSYQTDVTCKSYFDLYPDLARKIETARGNSPIILNLLRGFFFWLQHVPADGMFKPWLDRQCLSILPQTKAETLPSPNLCIASTAIVPFEEDKFQEQQRKRKFCLK